MTARLLYICLGVGVSLFLVAATKAHTPGTEHSARSFIAFWDRKIEQIKEKSEQNKHLKRIMQESRDRLENELSDFVRGKVTLESLAQQARKAKTASDKAVEAEAKRLGSIFSPSARARLKASETATKKGRKAFQEFAKMGNEYFSPLLEEISDREISLETTIQKRSDRIKQLDENIRRNSDAIRVIRGVQDDVLRESLKKADEALLKSEAETQRIFVARQAQIAARQPGLASQIAQIQHQQREAQRQRQRDIVWGMITARPGNYGLPTAVIGGGPNGVGLSAPTGADGRECLMLSLCMTFK